MGARCIGSSLLESMVRKKRCSGTNSLSFFQAMWRFLPFEEREVTVRYQRWKGDPMSPHCFSMSPKSNSICCCTSSCVISCSISSHSEMWACGIGVSAAILLAVVTELIQWSKLGQNAEGSWSQSRDLRQSRWWHYQRIELIDYLVDSDFPDQLNWHRLESSISLSPSIRRYLVNIHCCQQTAANTSQLPPSWSWLDGKQSMTQVLHRS